MGLSFSAGTNPRLFSLGVNLEGGDYSKSEYPGRSRTVGNVVGPRVEGMPLKPQQGFTLVSRYRSTSGPCCRNVELVKG